MFEHVSPASAHDHEQVQRLAALAADKAAQPPAPLSPADIQTIDEAFKTAHDADPAFAALVLWASTPLLADLVRDHLDREPPARPETEDERPS